MNGNASTCRFRLYSSDADTLEKFTGFANYLRDRKKAAVFYLKNDIEVYILPPATDRNLSIHGLACISKTDVLQISSETKTFVVPSATAESTSDGNITISKSITSMVPNLVSNHTSSSSQSTNKGHSIKHKTLKADDSNNDFLSSILSKVQ